MGALTSFLMGEFDLGLNVLSHTFPKKNISKLLEQFLYIINFIILPTGPIHSMQFKICLDKNLFQNN